MLIVTGGVRGYAKIGGTRRKDTLLGVEMNGWTKSEFGGRVTMGRHVRRGVILSDADPGPLHQGRRRLLGALGG